MFKFSSNFRCKSERSILLPNILLIDVTWLGLIMITISPQNTDLEVMIDTPTKHHSRLQSPLALDTHNNFDAFKTYTTHCDR